MSSRIYSHDVRDNILRKRKSINPKHYPTKTLKAFRENGYVGVDGLDREQYKDEIDSEYYKRMNKHYELDSKTIDDQWEQWYTAKENLPPAFPFEWSEELQDYLIP